MGTFWYLKTLLLNIFTFYLSLLIGIKTPCENIRFFEIKMLFSLSNIIMVNLKIYSNEILKINIG